VIPNAYTGELVSDHEAPAADPLRILYMGQLEEHKGVPLLFQALESLWAGGSQLQATIAGAGSLSQEAERFAGVHAERCQFVGRIAGEEKQRALRESSVVLFPSIWREPFGLGVIEGFAYGRPVIACEGSGGPEEMIRDGVDGRIVPPTSAGIAAAIREYVDRPGRLQMHAEASWKRREEFGAETMARRYVAAYEGASADLS
jgi:glycosyltransferase involved in cell wall biosynthesis